MEKIEKLVMISLGVTFNENTSYGPGKTSSRKESAELLQLIGNNSKPTNVEKMTEVNKK